MNRITLLAIPIFLFCLISIPSLAYKEYNNNALINGTTGFYIEDIGQTYYPCWFLFTCTNSSSNLIGTRSTIPLTPNAYGTIVLNNSATSNSYESIAITPMQYPNIIISSNHTAYSDYTTRYPVEVPANVEPIVSISVRLNNTNNLTLARIDLVDSANSYATQINVLGNITNNSNVSFNLLLPRTTASTEIYATLVLEYQGMNPYATIEIGEFKIYTFDGTDTFLGWNTNNTYNDELYCGKGATHTIDRTLTTNGTAKWFICQSNEGYRSMVMTWGDIITTRRLSVFDYSYSGSTYDNVVMGSNDGNFYILGNGVATGTSSCFWTSGYDVSLIAERMLTGEIKYSTICAGNGTKWGTNGTNACSGTNYGRFCLAYDVSGTVSLRNLVIDNPTALRETLTYNTTYISSLSATGNHWKLRNAYSGVADSSYYDFFTGTTTMCEARSQCNPSTNNQSYILPNCTVIAQASCGLWGCASDGTTCDYGAYGTYCTDNYGYTTTAIDGSVSYDSCFPNLCRNVSSGGIKCVNSANTSITCINSNGTATSCDSVDPSSSANFFTNPMNSLALTIGGFFGSTDLGASRNVASLIFSFILGLIGVIVIAGLSHKMDGKMLGAVFMLGIILGVLIFTIVGWLNPLIMILVIILDALLLAKMLGVIGGGE